MIKALAAKAGGGSPVRTCIVRRVQQNPASMIRFVLSPENAVVPDIEGKLPGRGVYVSAHASDVRTAVKKNAFAKAFKQKVEVSVSLDADIDKLLEAAALQALSIANKAGALIAGSAKIEAALANKTVTAILHAHDGAEDGIRKLTQFVRRSEVKTIVDLRIFSISQLENALGKGNVIHAAVINADAGRFFTGVAKRLQDYRSDYVAREIEEIFCDEEEICDKADEISAE